MNKIKIFAYIVVASVSALACRDAIDIVQDGEITKEVAIQSTGDLNRFLIGNVYSSLNPLSEIALTSYFTDENAVVKSNTGWYLSEFRYQLYSDNGYVAGTWLNHYNTIDKVNRLIDLSKLITPSSSEEKQYNSILAQGRALRAYSYLTLLSYFSTDMKKDDALGVILSTEVQPVNAQLPRATNGEIYKFMEEDLAFAEKNINTAASDYKYVTLAMIKALQARLYAYRGKYDLAEKYAKEAIAQSPALSKAPGTTLSAMPYANMWKDSERGEVIFALSRPQAGSWSNIAALWTTNTTDINGAAQMGMSLKLYDLYGARDIRRVVFVDASSDDDNKIIDKYPGKGNTPLRNDIKIFRTTEVKLILAESYIYQNKLAEAASIMQEVRNARLYGGTVAPLPKYATQKEAYADLLLERRLEFCYEGHRYVDLKRLGAIAGVSIDRSERDDRILKSTPLTLPITDHRFTFPIPQNEILGNPAISNQQNPGY